MFRFLRYAIEFVAAFAGFIVLLAILLAWRLNAHPLSSDFLTPYIESAVEEFVPGSEVHAGSSLLTWDNVNHSVSVHIENITINDGEGAEIAEIGKIDAEGSLFGLLFGQFLPKNMTVEHPQIKLERNQDGAFVFGSVSVGGKSSDNKNRKSIKDTLRNLTEHLSHAALMNRLAVTAASFEVHDDLTGQEWAVNVPEISIARTSFSDGGHSTGYGALEGKIILDVSQKDGTARLDVNYSYDPRKITHHLSTTFDSLNPAYLAGGHPETLGLGVASQIDLPLTGKIEAVLSKKFDILDASLQTHGEAGHVTYTDFWDAPVLIKSLDLAVDYDLASQKLTVTNTQIDFDGPVLTLGIDGARSKHAGQDMDLTISLQVDNMPMNSYGKLWPKSIVPNARYWLDANLRDGTFTHADVTLHGFLAWANLSDMAIADGSGKVSAVNGKVTYLDGMPPVTGVNADASFDLKSLKVQVNAGSIGNIHLEPFEIEITGLADEDQNIHIPLRVSGPVPEVMALLDHQPLGYAKKLGVAPDDIQGDVEGEVDFKFPLLRTLAMKDLTIVADANARGIASKKLVPGVDVDQGNVALTLDMSGFALKGQANLDKVPFQITWHQLFTAIAGKPLQDATINGTVGDDQWKDLGFNVFTGTKGPVAVSFQMTRATKTRTQFSAALDMSAAAIEVDLLDWKKPANVAASLQFAATANTGKPIEITSIEMRGDQLAASGTATLSPDMTQVLALNMQQLMIGRTNTSLHFNQTYGEGGTVKLVATGKALDISGLSGAKDSKTSDPRPQDYTVKVDRLYTGLNGEIDMAQGHAVRDAQGWSTIDVQGIVGAEVGEGKPLSFKLLPDEDGHRSLSIICDDFGEAMKGLGFTGTIRGGRLEVTGASSVDQPRRIIGSARISSFTIENLPVLALLLNALSPFGFGGILTDSADFSRFEGNYVWEGDTLTLTKAHAAGSAVGINVDGTVSLTSGAANLEGTVVPFSVMNKILNYIPVIGHVITGGDNQGVLAVSYGIHGSLDKPDVSVNPISLLTPGFIRNLFFRDDIVDSTTNTPDKVE